MSFVSPQHLSPPSIHHRRLLLELMPRPQGWRRPRILRRIPHLPTQFPRRAPAPMRLVQQCAGQGYEVGLAFGHDTFGLLRIDDQTHGHYRKAGFPPDLGGEGDLVAGGQGDLGAQRYAAA